MKTKHQLLQEWNESTYGLEFGDYVYQYFVSEFNKPPVYGDKIVCAKCGDKGHYQFSSSSDEVKQCSCQQTVSFEMAAIEYHAKNMHKSSLDGHPVGYFIAGAEYAASRKALPPSPGSVDVEDKKECKCERDDCWQDSDGDIHCNKKVDGLGDSSGSEKDLSQDILIEDLMNEFASDWNRYYDDSEVDFLNGIYDKIKRLYTITRKP